MLKSLRYLISPKVIQQVNYSIYHYVKLSLLTSIYSIPWIITNIILRFSMETYILFALSFIFVLPTFITSFIFLDNNIAQELNFKTFSMELIKSYSSKFKLSFFSVLTISLLLLDYYVVINMMKLETLFMFMYIILMFVAIAMLYILILYDQKEYTWKQIIQKSCYFSWRYPFVTLCLFFILMCWMGLNYYNPFLNLIFGNGLCFGVVYRIAYKKTNR